MNKTGDRIVIGMLIAFTTFGISVLAATFLDMLLMPIFALFFWIIATAAAISIFVLAFIAIYVLIKEDREEGKIRPSVQTIPDEDW